MIVIPLFVNTTSSTEADDTQSLLLDHMALDAALLSVVPFRLLIVLDPTYDHVISVTLALYAPSTLKNSANLRGKQIYDHIASSICN